MRSRLAGRRLRLPVLLYKPGGMQGHPLGSETPSFPLPLWLVALIIFILVVAIGGGLYLKSRLKQGESKK
jgi:hypothetical protein